MFHQKKERLRFNLFEIKKIQNACPSLTVYGNWWGGATIVEKKEE